MRSPIFHCWPEEVKAPAGLFCIAYGEHHTHTSSCHFYPVKLTSCILQGKIHLFISAGTGAVQEA